MRTNRRGKTMLALIPVIIALAAAGGWQGLNYSPYGNQAGAQNMAILLGAALALALVFAVLGLSMIIQGAIAEMRALGMTPGQQALAEAVLMEGAHLAWSEHNRHVSERLTASVMGPERDA